MSIELVLSLPPPVGNLNAYLTAINSQPLLEAAEERELARRFRDHGDRNAAWILVSSHLRFVARLARGYAGYGLPQEDLIQEGNVGLMKAVKRFDPDWGVRLVSFAVHWIRAEIHEFILRNWRVVKVATTKAQRKLFFKLRSAKKRLAWMRPDEAREVAAEFGVEPKEVMEMEKRLYVHDKPFDAPMDPPLEERPLPAMQLEDWRFEPEHLLEEAEWEDYSRSRLYSALETLDDRSRDILTRRWLADENATLQELAREYGVSAERIRQIESKAIEKLRKAVAH